MSFLSRIFSPRETPAQRAQWLDTTVRAAAHAAYSRIADARTASRSFEAAETPAWTDSWATHTADINDDLARQLPTLRARALGLARNNEWAAGYLLALDDNVLGQAGIRLQMRCKTPSGKLDTEANSALERAWDRWGRRGVCEVSKRHTWREVESLVLGALPRAGEHLARDCRGVGPMGYQLQLFNPALLDVSLRRDWQGRRVRMGVEIDDDGVPVAYWVRAAKLGDGPSETIAVGRHVRIPASEIHHAFETHETGQLRGIPWLTVGARRLWLLSDFEQSAAVASSNAAKRQGFFVSPNGEAPPGFADTIVSSVLDAAKAAGKVLTPEEIQTLTATAAKFATTVPGQFDTIPTGYDFRPFESQWPNIQADTYVKQQIRGWATARGSSYVTLGNDLEAVNYSSAQLGVGGEREHWKTVQSRLVGWLHAPVFERVLPYLILSEPTLKASRLQYYLEGATWQPRRWQPVDAAKTATANETNLRLKLTTRRRLLTEQGEDADEIFAEAEEEERRFGPLEKSTSAAKPEPDDDDTTTAAAGKSRA